MPVLPNAKHERFAQGIADGKTIRQSAALSDISLSSCSGRHGYYVYLLMDPRYDSPFYVGKGKGNRAFQHFKEWKAGKIVNQEKFDRIGEIVGCGLTPLPVCVEDELLESQAFDLEFRLISAIGRDRLSNYAAGAYSDLTQAAIKAKAQLSKIRPFCRWKESILPQLDGASEYEALYWDVIGQYSHIIAVADGAIHSECRFMSNEIRDNAGTV